MRLVAPVSNTGLSAVEIPPRHLKFSQLSKLQSEHSLHELVQLKSPALVPIQPSIARSLVTSLCPRGGLVYIPMSGSGTIALEAHIAGRKIIATDPEPLFTLITQGKLSPVDIAQAAIALQYMDFKRPIPLERFHQGFDAFYDEDTFREISCFRFALKEIVSGTLNGSFRFLDDSAARTALYLSTVALGLLHGHTVGHLSSYSSPYESLAPSVQEKINRDRGALPGYRAFVPRILRKVAQLSRDCRPSQFSFNLNPGQVQCGDPRSAPHISSGSIDLTCMQLPLPHTGPRVQGQWLRLWLSGDILSPNRGGDINSLQEWQDWLEEVLFEVARITRPDGYVALLLTNSFNEKKEILPLYSILTTILSECYASFWEIVQTVNLNNSKTLHRHQAKHSDNQKLPVKPAGQEESYLANRQTSEHVLVVVLRRRRS
jgi:hypothetical protein